MKFRLQTELRGRNSARKIHYNQAPERSNRLILSSDCVRSVVFCEFVVPSVSDTLMFPVGARRIEDGEPSDRKRRRANARDVSPLWSRKSRRGIAVSMWIRLQDLSSSASVNAPRSKQSRLSMGSWCSDSFSVDVGVRNDLVLCNVGLLRIRWELSLYIPKLFQLI